MDHRKLEYYRKAECFACGVIWKYRVVLADNTTNLSGETSSYCPACGKKADYYGPVYKCEEVDE